MKLLSVNEIVTVEGLAAKNVGAPLFDSSILYESVCSWEKRYSKKFELIVIDDPKGKYTRDLKERKTDNK